MVRLILLAALLAAPAAAQVSVNSGALDRLTPNAPAPGAPASRAAPRPAQPARTAHAPVRTVAKPATAAAPARPGPRPAASQSTVRPRVVSVAPAPPPVAVLAPPVQAPAPPPAGPPPVPVLADAAGEASKIAGGVRVTFGPGKADLNPGTAEALRTLARAVKADPNVDLNLYSYAAGQPDDPSTPRRLSLSRALAVRAMLISEGIVSTRIYPRALGATLSDGPADRVDVTSGAPGPPPPAQPTLSPAR